MTRAADTTGTELLDEPGRIIAWNLTNRRCPVCRCHLNRGMGNPNHRVEIDHVVAHNAGGGVEGNLAPLCASCNGSKQDTPLDEWLPARLVALGDYTAENAWCRRRAAELAEDIFWLQLGLTRRLVAEGIWDAADVELTFAAANND